MADHSPPIQSKYLLPHDEAERERLNDQHVFLHKVVYEGRLVYDETINLHPHSRILDSGTGTGAWILDLAKEVPETVTLHGIDISPNKFPENTAANVHLSAASITKLPEEWSGTFDLINQRLLSGGLQAMEWPVAISEMFRVLKPGGAIQLVEVDPTYPAALKRPAMRRIIDIVTSLFNVKGLLAICAIDMPEMLKKAGFIEVTSERKFVPVGSAWGRMGIEGVKSVRGSIGKLGEAAVSAEFVKSIGEYNDVLDEIESEWGEEATQFLFPCIMGRKPM